VSRQRILCDHRAKRIAGRMPPRSLKSHTFLFSSHQTWNAEVSAGERCHHGFGGAQFSLCAGSGRYADTGPDGLPPGQPVGIGQHQQHNYQAPAIPGALANPTPGTIVVHINGKVQTTFQSEWGSADTHQITATAAQAAISGNSTVAPAGSPGGPPLTVVVPAGGVRGWLHHNHPDNAIADLLGRQRHRRRQAEPIRA
jgi:hypothetical protein